MLHDGPRIPAFSWCPRCRRIVPAKPGFLGIVRCPDCKAVCVSLPNR